MVLIADSGSTKTSWAMLGKDIFETAGINPQYQSEAQIAEIVMGIELEDEPKSIYSYGTGLTSEAYKDLLMNVLGKRFPEAVIEVNSDLLGAARSVLGLSSGLSIILGTGSNAAYFDGHSLASKVPALGFWLGDEGSGGYFGKELIKLYLRNELDNAQEFEQSFGKVERNLVLGQIKDHPRPSAYFAAFVPFLKKHEEEPQIAALLRSGFEAFALHYLSKYELKPTDKIGVVGSVGFYFQGLVREVFENYVTNEIVFLQKPITGLVEFHR